jgi:hypothetical protein
MMCSTYLEVSIKKCHGLQRRQGNPDERPRGYFLHAASITQLCQLSKDEDWRRKYYHQSQSLSYPP